MIRNPPCLVAQPVPVVEEVRQARTPVLKFEAFGELLSPAVPEPALTQNSGDDVQGAQVDLEIFWRRVPAHGLGGAPGSAPGLAVQPGSAGNIKRWNRKSGTGPKTRSSVPEVSDVAALIDGGAGRKKSPPPSVLRADAGFVVAG